MAVFLAFLHVWSTQQTNPIVISRKQIMKLSRIKSIVTYQKIIRELHEGKYIMYSPSYNPQAKTLVKFPKELETTTTLTTID
jgi:hypothetical protein